MSQIAINQINNGDSEINMNSTKAPLFCFISKLDIIVQIDSLQPAHHLSAHIVEVSFDYPKLCNSGAYPEIKQCNGNTGTQSNAFGTICFLGSVVLLYLKIGYHCSNRQPSAGPPPVRPYCKGVFWLSKRCLLIIQKVPFDYPKVAFPLEKQAAQDQTAQIGGGCPFLW